MKIFFSLTLLCFLQVVAVGQSIYSISGSVTDTSGMKIQSATVFIANTEKITTTNESGSFSFTRLPPGNYSIVVNMLGYAPVKHELTIKDHSVDIKLQLVNKQIKLNEVTVGAKKQSPKDLERFTKFFLGHMYDDKLCKILNPELINFNHTDTVLTATSDDFLIIENQILGYRIKYLLKSFFCKRNNTYLFDGDFSFEALKGTVQQQKIWDKNRQIAYEGSMMHFLRALYAGTTRQEGFLVYRSTTDSALVLERNPSDPQQFVKRIDSNMVSVNVKPVVLVVRDKEKADKPDVISKKEPRKITLGLSLPNKFTLFKLTAKLDSRGSVTDRSFIFYHGYWGMFGVANQLPFEYMPPIAAN